METTCMLCEKLIFEHLPPMCCGCHYHCECYCRLKANKQNNCIKCDKKLRRNLRKSKRILNMEMYFFNEF